MAFRTGRTRQGSLVAAGRVIPALRELVATDALAATAAVVGRFYGDGLIWALALPLPELVRWNKLRATVQGLEAPQPVILYKPR